MQCSSQSDSGMCDVVTVRIEDIRGDDPGRGAVLRPAIAHRKSPFLHGNNVAEGRCCTGTKSLAHLSDK